MTNEIKEIIEINGTKYTVSLPKEIIKAFSCIDNELSVCSNDLPKILDYITNLQEENEKQHKGFLAVCKEAKDLEQRIDKAIDKLESLLPMCIMPNNMLIHGTEKAKAIEETLDILRGDE